MAEKETIHSALLKAQPLFKKPVKNADNKHFGQKYADLSAVIDAVKPILNNVGIVYYHRMEVTELGEQMVTTLHHPDSSTELEFPVPLIIGKRDMQGLKSAQTYAKRIGLEDATGVSAGEDDDAEQDRTGNTMGAALKDAWRQSVLDNLPEGATPAEKAKAFATAICEDFANKKEKALQNRWSKHKGMIGEFEGRFPELHGKVIDAYETAMMEATGNYTRNAAE